MRNASMKPVGIMAIIAMIITLIINLSCPTAMWAQNTKPGETAVPATVKSTAYCLPAIQGGMGQAFGFDPPVQTTTPAQQEFVQKYFKLPMQLEWSNTLKKEGVLDFRSGSSAEVQSWLASKGFEMSLSGGDAVASVFELQLDWQKPGVPTQISVDSEAYKASRFNIEKLPGPDSAKYAVFKPVKEVKGFTGPHFYMPVTKDGWQVSIIETDGKLEGLALIEACRILKETAQEIDTSFTAGTVTIPSISLSAEVDISVLNGLKGQKNGKKFKVDQALKICKLDFGPTGLKASSAVALHSRGWPPASYVIDGPFAVIIWHKDGVYPAFAALCGPDSWVKDK